MKIHALSPANSNKTRCGLKSSGVSTRIVIAETYDDCMKCLADQSRERRSRLDQKLKELHGRRETQ